MQFDNTKIKGIRTLVKFRINHDATRSRNRIITTTLGKFGFLNANYRGECPNDEEFWIAEIDSVVIKNHPVSGIFILTPLYKVAPDEYDYITHGLYTYEDHEGIRLVYPKIQGGQFGVIRWNLEQSILIAPLEPGQPAEQSNNPAAIVAKRLGIRSERGVKGNSEFLNIWCTLGASALGDLNDIVPGLGDSVSLRDYEANDGGMSYPGSMLTEGMSNGTVLVAPTPQEGVSLETTAWSAVHDNILHLYGNLLLRTPEFNELVRQFGPEKDVGKLDSSLAYAAGHIHGLRDYSWYNKLIGKEHFAPYAGLRGFLGTFLDSGNSSVKRLNREIELLNKFRTGKASELEEDEYRTLVLGKDSVLDQFDQAANSIPQRFLAVTADLYKEPALDNSKIVAITQALASQLLKV